MLSLHFIPGWRSSAKCPGQDSCFLCAKHRKKQDYGTVVVSPIGSDKVTLLRMTSSQHQLIQALEIMGPNLQGKKLLVTGYKHRTLGARIEGATVTQFVPSRNYLDGIGRKLYDDLVRLEIKELNSLFDATGG